MEKENWKEAIIESMKGSKSAQPRTDLFTDIEGALNLQNERMLPAHLRISAVAAILLIVLNLSVFHQLLQSNDDSSELVTIENQRQQLFSDYKLYD